MPHQLLKAERTSFNHFHADLLVIKGGADFIQSYFGISYQVSLLAFVAVVAVYVFMGGIKGVMYTDAFQGLLMFAGMTFLVVFKYSKLGGIASAHRQLADLYNDPAAKEQAAAFVKGGFAGWTSMPRFGTPIWWNLVSTVVMGVGIGIPVQPQLAGVTNIWARTAGIAVFPPVVYNSN